MYGHTAQPQKRRLPISGDRTDYQFTVLFPVDEAAVESSELDSISAFAPMMVGKLNRIEVRGHSLRRPLPKDGPFSDHWALCYARCQAVKKALEDHGIEPERIRLSQAEGNEPLALNLSEEELKLNSRVDVILLPDLAEIPWERPNSATEQMGDELSAQEEPHAPADDDGEQKHAIEPVMDAEHAPEAEPPTAAHDPPHQPASHSVQSTAVDASH
jgi:hypothetical protein